MNSDQSWSKAPPYTNNDPAFEPRYGARCFCGAVVFEVSAEPVDSKICHCRQCQALHGAPCQWAVIFHKSDVRFVKGADQLYFFNSGLGHAEHNLPCKLSCKICRAPIADEGRRMFLAFGPLFDFGFPPQIPVTFQPTCHIFYGTRVMDVNDSLPKFMGHKEGPLQEGGTS